MEFQVEVAIFHPVGCVQSHGAAGQFAPENGRLVQVAFKDRQNFLVPHLALFSGGLVVHDYGADVHGGAHALLLQKITVHF